MTNHLGTYFRERRQQRGLSLGQLARLLGCRNVSKGSNRIARLRQGAVKEGLLLHLAEALGIDLPTVEGLLEQDHQERLRGWEEWVSQPVPMRLIVRYLPAVYGRVALPEGATTPEEAEQFACDYARRPGRRVCLAVSRRLSVWINKDGRVAARTEATPDGPNVPYMGFKRSAKKFLFGFEERGASAPPRP
jgi:transcriptional regulator with XRE-family HTH domain